MDYRFMLGGFLVVGLAVVILILHKARGHEQELNKVIDKAKATERRMFQLEEYRDQLTDMRDSMRIRLEEGIHDVTLSSRWNEARGEALTGIAIADVVLHEKRESCRSAGIECDYRIRPIPEGVLDEKYWPGLLGNLIDNGIEAVLKCEKGHGWIRVTTDRRANQWTLKVENSKPEDEHPLANGMASTKPDKANHGIGSRVVDKIVKDAGGYIKRTDGGSSFTVFVALPVRTENEKCTDY